jgi:hypothetical protein
MITALVPLNAPENLALQDSSAPAPFLKEARAAERFFDMFTSNVQHRNARRAYFNAACRFLGILWEASSSKPKDKGMTISTWSQIPAGACTARSAELFAG